LNYQPKGLAATDIAGVLRKVYIRLVWTLQPTARMLPLGLVTQLKIHENITTHLPQQTKEKQRLSAKSGS